MTKKRGGKRPGAGRPKGEPTKLVRVPVRLVDEVKKIIDRERAAKTTDSHRKGCGEEKV